MKKNNAPQANESPRNIQEWCEAGELVELNGHRIFVIDEGDRALPALVLIHGFPTASWDWASMWPALCERFRVIALDMLGFGYSDKPNRRNYTIHKQADLVEALIRSKQLDEYHVLAHDYGDTVAQELLARQLDGTGAGRWLSGCFLNGGLFPETHRALFMQKLLLSPVGPLVSRLSNYSKFEQSFGKIFGPNTQPSETELKSFWTLINENDGKHLFHNLITYMRDRKIHRERWVAALQNSLVPLAVINGSVDPISGEHMVKRYQELACRLDYLGQLDNIGHYPQVEDPAGVLGHYFAFMNACKA